MELSSLKKEYQLVTQDHIDKFIELSHINPSLVLVEEYWITSDKTLGNRCAYFEAYHQAEEYAYLLAANRAALNTDNKKPFMIKLNGRETTVDGHLNDFFEGKFTI
ncbi:hypothetical protein [Eubacterium oxidoreducens]|uniref:Uncharacterized protein n=1 Tax=Eubacterium oxidoreducens TaxID=1732 RepID=A0A1G6CQT9_EUBOX|nr:hypothetical protein [Eubacterium oxidoreducens]SDB35247.1 hypothetical protein SAMN02910417_02598 [Eubacterium oxidoreducens]